MAETAEKNVNKLDKDQLEQYARDEFNVELDKRRKLTDLRAQVIALQKGETPAQDKASTEQKPSTPRFLLHTGNKRVFEYTEYLAARSDMVPCDWEGNRI